MGRKSFAVQAFGILLLVQGIGGFINRISDSDSKSWFVALHVLPPAFHIPGCVLIAVAGLSLVTGGSKKGKND